MKRVHGIRAVTRDRLVRRPVTPMSFRPFHDLGHLRVGEKVELAAGFELRPSGDRYGKVVRLAGAHKVRIKMFRTGKVITLPIEAVQRENDVLGEYSI